MHRSLDFLLVGALQAPRDQHLHDLVGAGADAHDPGIPIHVRDGVFFHVTITAKQLQGSMIFPWMSVIQYFVMEAVTVSSSPAICWPMQWSRKDLGQGCLRLPGRLENASSQRRPEKPRVASVHL